MMGICRSKWGAIAGIWVGQWRAGGGGAPRSGTRGWRPGLTSEVPALVGGPGGQKGLSLPLFLRWWPEVLPILVIVLVPGRARSSAVSQDISLYLLSSLKVHFHHSLYLEVDLE